MRCCHAIDCSSEMVICAILSLSLPSNAVTVGMSAEGEQHRVCPRRILVWILALLKCQNAAFGRCVEGRIPGWSAEGFGRGGCVRWAVAHSGELPQDPLCSVEREQSFRSFEPEVVLLKRLFHPWSLWSHGFIGQKEAFLSPLCPSLS